MNLRLSTRQCKLRPLLTKLLPPLLSRRLSMTSFLLSKRKKMNSPESREKKLTSSCWLNRRKLLILLNLRDKELSKSLRPNMRKLLPMPLLPKHLLRRLSMRRNSKPLLRLRR